MNQPVKIPLKTKNLKALLDNDHNMKKGRRSLAKTSVKLVSPAIKAQKKKNGSIVKPVNSLDISMECLPSTSTATNVNDKSNIYVINQLDLNIMFKSARPEFIENNTNNTTNNTSKLFFVY